MAAAQMQRVGARERAVAHERAVTRELRLPQARVIVLAFTALILGGIALDLALLAAPGLLPRIAGSLVQRSGGVALILGGALLAAAIPAARWEWLRLSRLRLLRVREQRIAELTPFATLLRVSPLVLDRVTVKTLHDLSPTAFELAMGDLLKLYNYRNVRHTGGSGDLCVDLTAEDSKGKHVVVQCKRYAPGSNVGSQELQTFLGMMTIHYHAPLGLYFTTSSYTKPALDLAAEHRDRLQLYNGDDLVAMVHALAVR